MESSRAVSVGTSEISYLEARPKARPLALTVEVPEVVGEKNVGVEMDVPPGVYAVSVSASVEEGNARYGFGVVVE